MSFAGLRELLQKKKAQVKNGEDAVPSPPAPSSHDTTATTTGSHPTSPPSLANMRDGPSDPYAAAIRSALASKEQAATHDAPQLPESGHKRQRSTSPPEADKEQAGEGPVPPVVQREMPPLLAKSEFEAQRDTMLTALTACMDAVSPFVKARARRPPQTAAASAMCDGRNAVGVPLAMRQFLMARYVRQERDTGGSPEEAEYAVLRDTLAELTAASTTQTHGGKEGNAQTPARDRKEDDREEEEGLTALIRALWYLAAAYWHAAILGCAMDDAASVSAKEPTRQSAELMAEYGAIKGWCFASYLLAAHALPDVMRFTCGQETAMCLETWRTAKRSVNGALELLAYLLLDLEAREGSPSPPLPDAKDHVVVPVAIRDGLHRMICRCVQSKGDFTGARQAYTDFTMGNANWKLGLFSAGEVHMRRSVEKLERNRMLHVLNNELAMRLLHATRELVVFAERHRADQRLRDQFFLF